jgi:uncharacterized protein (DUF1778 family)
VKAMMKVPPSPDTTRFVLDSAPYDAFVAMLDNPPLPGPKLRALSQRKPAWASSER